MISVKVVQKSTIRSDYQLGTFCYRLLWGSHIHDGLWDREDSRESVIQAQCQLTDTLAGMAVILPHDKVIDVGCGMGWFIDGFDTLLRAYRTGVMSYGAIVAQKD